MVSKYISKTLLAASLLSSGLVYAGEFSTNTVTVGPGLTTSVTVSFAGDAATVDAQIDLDFPNTDLTVSAPVIVNPGSVCSIIDTNTIRIIPPSGGAVPLPSTATATCSFTFTAGTPAVLPQVNSFTINATNPNECTSTAATVACTLASGTVTIQAGPPASYLSVPAAGPIVINDVVGGAGTTATLTVTNDGSAGPPAAPALSVTPSGLSGDLSISPAVATSINQGANQAFTITCAATAAGTTTQTLTMTHDGDTNPASPVTYQVDCVGSVTNTPGTLTVGPVTQPNAGVAGGTAAGSAAVAVASPGVATASTTLNCTIPATAPSNFAITSGGNQVLAAPIGAVANVGLSCVRQVAAVTAQLTCTQVDTPDVTNPDAVTVLDVTCPAGTTGPNPASTPATGGTVTATGPVGVPTPPTNVTFSNVGAAPAVTAYNVTCTTAAPYAVTPAGAITVNPGATASVGVTCTPAALGPNPAGTLTCTSTAAGFNPTFTLACNGIVSGPIPSMSDMGKLMLIALVLGLGLMGFAFRRSV